MNANKAKTNDENINVQRKHFESWKYPEWRSEATSEVSTNFFVWRLDLSGSLQGAGGVGGLLAESPSDIVHSLICVNPAVNRWIKWLLG